MLKMLQQILSPKMSEYLNKIFIFIVTYERDNIN